MSYINVGHDGTPVKDSRGPGPAAVDASRRASISAGLDGSTCPSASARPVLFVLVGEALVLRSRPHLAWAVVFLAINAVYIPAVEEPQLARRFGEDYRRYRRHVGRLLPGLSPWSPSAPALDEPGDRA
jgi:hypothetical protein